MNVVVIIQARLGSTRLPNKMMLSLKNRSIISWVITRAQRSKKIDNLILATSQKKENDLLEWEALNLKCPVYRGSENDVLNRFYEAAKQMNATHVVRVCADNPLVSPSEIDNLITFYFNNKCDYAYNHIPKNNTYPDGLGAEIISFELLKKLENEVKSPLEREHCFLHINNNPDKFIVKTFNPILQSIAFPNLKLDIDTFDDFYFMSKVPFNENMNDQELINCFLKFKDENS
jgi:spore coat polysaccharide biosynthesis protein SpsF